MSSSPGDTPKPETKRPLEIQLHSPRQAGREGGRVRSVTLTHGYTKAAADAADPVLLEEAAPGVLVGRRRDGSRVGVVTLRRAMTQAAEVAQSQAASRKQLDHFLVVENEEGVEVTRRVRGGRVPAATDTYLDSHDFRAYVEASESEPAELEFEPLEQALAREERRSGPPRDVEEAAEPPPEPAESESEDETPGAWALGWVRRLLGPDDESDPEGQAR